MAKRRKRYKKIKKNYQREISYITSRIPRLVRPIKEVQDGRRFRPLYDFPSRDILGRPANIKASTETKAKGKRIAISRSGIRYANPRIVITCKRRGARRSALFAKKKAGKGISTRNYKKRRMTENSKVRC